MAGGSVPRGPGQPAPCQAGPPPASLAAGRAAGQGLPRGYAGTAAGWCPGAFVARISSRPRGSRRFTAPCPLNGTGLLIIVTL